MAASPLGGCSSLGIVAIVVAVVSVVAQGCVRLGAPQDVIVELVGRVFGLVLCVEVLMPWVLRGRVSVLVPDALLGLVITVSGVSAALYVQGVEGAGS